MTPGLPLAPQVRSRYPGTHPFGDTPDDRARFFGRDTEVEELYLRVLSVKLLVQFGRSGLGKTSLLQAGLFPRLRQKPYLPVMIRLNTAGDSLTASVMRSLREACEAEGLEFVPGDTSGLWELLTTTTVWRDDLLLTPVLVFDQFEEVFTLRDAAFRAELQAELGALASDKPPARLQATPSRATPAVKIVLSLREDHLGELEAFSSALPALFHERMRLEAMTEDAARAAITGPAQLVPEPDQLPYASPLFEYDKAALDEMIASLKGSSGVIEPFQLQLLCGHAEAIATRKGTGSVRLTSEDFRGAQRFAAVFDNFYRGTLDRLSPAQRRKAAELCEEGLLDGAGHRLMLNEAQIVKDYDLKRPSLETLCDARLLRTERRHESTFYEISHDQIAESIVKARQHRIPKKVRRGLWAAGIAAVIIVALLLVWNQSVERQRQDAQEARDNAEGLLTFLLSEEFLGEVRDTGRSTMLGAVRKKVDQSGTTGQATLAGALALRHAGDMNRIDGDVAGALDRHQRSLAILENLHLDREIARAHVLIAEDLEKQGRYTDALRTYDLAIQAWQRIAPRATPDDCAAMADTRVRAAALNNEAGRLDRSADHLQHAVRIASNILFGGQGPCAARWVSIAPFPHPGAVGVLSFVASTRAYSLPPSGADAGDAEKKAATEDANGTFALADHAHRLKPQSVEARLQALFALVSRGDRRPPAEALEDYRQALAGFEELRRWDPENRQWMRERAVVQLRVSTKILDCLQAPPAAPCARVPPMSDVEAMTLDSLATLQTLARQYPANADFEKTVEWALSDHAAVLAAGKRYDEAVARLEEAERHHQAFRADPADVDHDLTLGMLLQQSTHALVMSDRAPKAAETVQRLIGLFERLVREHPEHPVYLHRLEEARWWEVDVRGRLGDGKGAAAAREEGTRLSNAHTAFEERSKQEQARLLTVDNERYKQGKTLYGQKNYKAALREFLASEAASREYLVWRPAASEGYSSLRLTYDWIAATQAELGNDAGQLAALIAAMNAAQMAAWLAEESLRETTNMLLFDKRLSLTTFLLRQQRLRDTVPILRENVALAEELSQNPACSECRWLLGKAKAHLALLSFVNGEREWDERMRGGMIQMEAAANEAGTAEKFNYLGAWRNIVADHLENAELKAAAAEQRLAALDAYRRALRVAPGDEEAKAAVAELESLMK